MPRIPLFPTDTMTPEQRRVHDAVVSGPRGELRGPLRAALYRPELADKWQQFGELLRYRISLPPMLSELAILVTARHCHAQLEWFIHEQMAAKAGLAIAVDRTAMAASIFKLVIGFLPDLSKETRFQRRRFGITVTVH